MEAKAKSFQGLRILVAEDEALIMMELQDILEDLGCEVIGPLSTVSTTIAAIGKYELDGALLDMNLQDECILPAVLTLTKAGVPFLLVTGCASRLGDAPVLKGAPRLTKPFTRQTLTSAMAIAFATRTRPSKPSYN